MPTKYTAEELHDASKKVMQSLNRINAKPSRSLDKPAIRNSLGMASGRISKSARKRHARKERANLAGKPMENLLDVIPDAPEPEEAPKSVPELQAARVSQAEKRRHHSRKAEQKVVQHEIKQFTGSKSLNEIRANIMRMNAEKGATP